MMVKKECDEPPTKRSRLAVGVGVTDQLQNLLKAQLSAQAHCLVSEICTLQQRSASYQPEEESGGASDSGSHLSDLLQSTLHSTDDTGALLSADGCLQRLREVTHTAQDPGLREVTHTAAQDPGLREVTHTAAQDPGLGEVTHTAAQDQGLNSCLLSPQQRVKLGVVLSLLKALKEQQSHKWSETLTLLLKEQLPLEVIWQLHTNNIVSLKTFFDSVLGERGQCAHLTQQLIQLCVSPRQGTLNHRILSGLLDRHMESTDLLLHTDLGTAMADVSHVCFKKMCTHTVSLIMSHRHNMKVSEALKKQAQWKSANISDHFKTLYKQLLVPFESGEVVEMLQRILDKQEVKWQTLLSFLATFLVCFPSAAKDIQEHVGGLLGESLESGDMENTIVAFLLARQSCTEGPHVFPDYSRWFQETFGDSTRSPATSRKAFTFLVKFLTEIVPYEPADILKVHILRPPFLPAKCRDVWTDYTALAKTRLADLKVPLEETTAAIYTDPGNASGPGEAGMQDVEKAVAVFESSGKLPTTVMEASIFRKPYFVGKFLPALLQPRHLPDVADSRMKFIEALKKAGKIPSSLFLRYEEACRRETRLLLEGVFVEEEEEGVEEMMMSPQEQLTYRLTQLTEAVIAPATENRVSEVVSVVSEKLQGVLCPSPEEAVLCSESCVLNLCQPALSPPQVKAVEAILNCVCRTVHASRDVSQHAWLGQVVRMVSQHRTLLPALFTQLLALFSCKTAALSQHHLEGVARFIAHLASNTCLFPPLLLQCRQGVQSPHLSFLTLFLHTLPVGTGRDMMQALRFLGEYLQWVFVGQSASVADSTDLAAVLPPHLVTMTCLLAWRVFPWSRPHQSSQLTPPPPLPPSAATGGEGKGDWEGGEEEAESIMAALFASQQFQQVMAEHRPTLADWLRFELGVDPAADVLSSLQRQTYHDSMVSDLTGSGSSSDREGRSHLQHTCCLLMDGLLTAMSRSQRAAGECTLCQQSFHVNPSSPHVNPSSPHVNPSSPHVNPHALHQMLSLLTRLVQSAWTADTSIISEEEEEEGGGGEPWVVNHLLKQHCGDGDTAVPDALLRVMLSCPPCALFTVSSGQAVTVKSVQCTVRLLQDFLVGTAAEGGVLPLDVIHHLLQGHLAVSQQCRDGAVMTAFEHHPLVLLSALVHWHSLCVLLPSLPSSAPWARLAACVDFWNRHCSEGPLSSVPNTQPFCLAASLYSSQVYRQAGCAADKRRQLLQCLQQQQPQALPCLNAILVASSSRPAICSPSLLPKIESGLQWLAELWALCPHLISATFSRGSELSTLRSSLMSADLEPFAELLCLRCVSSVGTDRLSCDSHVLPTVTQLFARLCQRFEEGSLKQSADMAFILDFSHTLVTLMRTAPLASLHSADQADVKLCGLEAHRVYQQRLRD